MQGNLRKSFRNPEDSVPYEVSQQLDKLKFEANIDKEIEKWQMFMFSIIR